ncbi:MAG: phosphopantothenoylcysteine decarboxylase, partial [Actinobacteria bacterium]|nr:phosphopantothenoylcysteine decarboxylase [Actinomycetota bacterium]
AAAVSDIIPVKEFNYKLKKNDDIISKLNFKENINILQLLSKRKNTKQFLAGFSAESGENIENAKEKIAGKKIDMIILNDISRNDIGFGSDYNEVILIDKKGILKKIPKNKKNIISRLIWDEIVNNLKN